MCLWVGKISTEKLSVLSSVVCMCLCECICLCEFENEKANAKICIEIQRARLAKKI